MQNRRCRRVAFAASDGQGSTAVAEGQGSTAVAEGQGATAVADGQRTTAVADAAQFPESDDELSSGVSSVAGDTIVDSSGGEDSDTTAVASKHQARVFPKAPAHGAIPVTRGKSAGRNAEPEVGNFGLYFGNWGNRATLAEKQHQRRRRDAQDRQVLKSPAQVVILCEANEVVEESLKQPSVSAPAETAVAETSDDGTHPQSRLERRATHEHWVVRGNEKGSAVLVASGLTTAVSWSCSSTT